jgi:hypothetical protein
VLVAYCELHNCVQVRDEVEQGRFAVQPFQLVQGIGVSQVRKPVSPHVVENIAVHLDNACKMLDKACIACCHSLLA